LSEGQLLLLLLLPLLPPLSLVVTMDSHAAVSRFH
jgi:hypothetical protein